MELWACCSLQERRRGTDLESFTKDNGSNEPAQQCTRLSPSLTKASPRPSRDQLHQKSESWEEKCDLSLGRFGAIAAVDQVLREENAEIATNGARSRIARIGRSHHRADDLPRIFRTLDHCDHGRTSSNELHQLAEEWLVGVLAVVGLGGGAIDRAQFRRSNGEIAAFETTENFSDEASFDGVGLADDERAIHGPNARPTLSRYAIRLHRADQSPRLAISSTAVRAAPAT